MKGHQIAKRGRDESVDASSKKRPRTKTQDTLSMLSDELLLLLLSYLSVHDLNRCEQLSRRLRTLATDPQLWKSAYYERFVRPRAVRIPGLRGTGNLNRSLLYSSKISRWLDDGHLVRRGDATNWKRQYKLRYNWSRGSCKRTETKIAERPSIPPLLVRLHDGVIVTADPRSGLRAWTMNDGERLIAAMAWDSDKPSSAAPTSMAIDYSSTSTAALLVSVGSSDGSFGIYALDRRKQSLRRQYLHARSINGTVSAIALLFPYVVTLTEANLLSLYRFPIIDDEASDSKLLGQPQLLSSLKSYTVWPPLSLSIRRSSTGITCSIAYAMPTYTSGWSVGLQELQLSSDGTILHSRTATPVGDGFMPLSGIEDLARSKSSSLRASAIQAPLYKSSSSSAKLTSLSYTHPYLLAGHSDNTLTLYMVTSNTQELYIGPVTLLCGHTSSVSGAHIGDRGKAVSVSAQGNDLRVWELEGGRISSISTRRTALGEESVPIEPENWRADYQRGAVLNAAPQRDTEAKVTGQYGLEEALISSGWLSFDEEQVVMLAEKHEGAQVLVVYNFA
ncbi:MAG: hypothetical protein Q9181_007277 [Wetmoreana brouardii]